MSNGTMNRLVAGLTVLVLLLVGVVFYQANAIRQQSSDYTNFKAALGNDFKVFRNEVGDEVASVKTAQFASSDNFMDAIAALNAQGANIQSKVDANTQSLVLINRRVGGMLTGKTTIAGYDTLKNVAASDTGLKAYPVYAFADSTKWYTISGKVGYGHYQVTPLFADSIEIKGELEGRGLFKPKTLTAYALSKSPFVKTTGFKSIVLRKEPAPALGIAVKIGLVALGIFLGAKVF